jgi:hypothetical protein
MGRHADIELMLVIAWAAVGIGLTAHGGIARVIGLVLLALLVLLLLRGAFEWWRHERRMRAAKPDAPAAPPTTTGSDAP